MIQGQWRNRRLDEIKKDAAHAVIACVRGEAIAAVPKKPKNVKLKKGAALPRTGRAKTDAKDETVKISLDDWTCLREFHEWLQTPDAARVRKDQIHLDKQAVKDLLVDPPSRASLKRMQN